MLIFLLGASAPRRRAGRICGRASAVLAATARRENSRRVSVFGGVFILDFFRAFDRLMGAKTAPLRSGHDPQTRAPSYRTPPSCAARRLGKTAHILPAGLAGRGEAESHPPPLPHATTDCSPSSKFPVIRLASREGNGCVSRLSVRNHHPPKNKPHLTDRKAAHWPTCVSQDTSDHP